MPDPTNEKVSIAIMLTYSSANGEYEKGWFIHLTIAFSDLL